MRIIEISAKHFTLDAKLKLYLEEKIQKLIDYIPRHARKSATASAQITKKNARGADQIECEIILNLPNQQLVAKECRDGVLAAIDGAEDKMRSQIRKYKADLLKARDEGGFMGQLKRALKRK